MLPISQNVISHISSSTTSANNSDNDANAESIENTADLRADLEKLSVEYSALNDKYKRALAESDNMRKRLMRQIDETKVFGIQSFCKDLLDVADVLTLAVQSAPQDQLVPGKNPAFCDLFNGLKMTEQQLTKVFERQKLLQILPKEGDRFDPNIHEAVFQVPLSGDKKANTVAELTKVGYKLHDRTIRPAFVVVYNST